MSRQAAKTRLYLVPTASHAIKGETALQRAGIACTMIPVPRVLSSECGVCLQVDFTDREPAEAALAAAGVQVSGTHDVERQPRHRSNA